MPTDWAGTGDRLGRFIEQESRRTLAAYRIQSNLITEHANTEDALARGGYADRQLLELVQNSADALAGTGGGRIRVRLTRSYLYCADNGTSIDLEGVRALMSSRLSPKRGTSQIGRYGLGFKSVLNVTDAPEFFSRSGSFRFDRSHARDSIQHHVPFEAGETPHRWPTLRLPYPVDPDEAFGRDSILRLLSTWARNIVRLPLKPSAFERLKRQIDALPPEILLFVEHVNDLGLSVQGQAGRTFKCKKQGDRYILTTGRTPVPWRTFRRVHEVSARARADSRTQNGEKRVEITWAVPMKGRNRPGYFWKFFPTMTPCLVTGILNAQWKTNEDRQNLLPGAFNRELIGAAADLIVDSLPHLATKDDPARHLDALPRRKEPGDNELTDHLRSHIFARLAERPVVPDQDGILRRVTEVSYPPPRLPSTVLNEWSTHPGRPRNWLHHRAATRDRLATITRIMKEHPRIWSPERDTTSTTIPMWLEALVSRASSKEECIRASMKAVVIAASIPADRIRGDTYGKIVWTAASKWSDLDPEVLYLSGRETPTDEAFVHPRLQADPHTRLALKKLGIDSPRPEQLFRRVVDQVFRKASLGATDDNRATDLDQLWTAFWKHSRRLGVAATQRTIRKNKHWSSLLSIRTLDGHWHPYTNVLLPGPIVPEDGSRDSHITIDTQYHKADLPLLKALKVVDKPYEGYDIATYDYDEFTDYQTARRKDWLSETGRHRIRKDLLCFRKVRSDYQTTAGARLTSGPIQPLKHLSDEGLSIYTDRLLRLSSTFSTWTLSHNNLNYPSIPYRSPAIYALRKYGRIKLHWGTVKLAHGLGKKPILPEARRWLLSHPNSERIRKAFDIQIGSHITAEGTDEPLPLIDQWPGLKEHLDRNHMNLDLVTCDRLVSDEGETGLKSSKEELTIYVVRSDEEETELRSVLGVLEQHLPDDVIKRILLRQTRSDIKVAHAAVRSQKTTTERLLAAVGPDRLLHHLPRSLTAELDAGDGRRVAKAALAVYDVGALHQYRDLIGHLDPPKQWAGGRRAVEFVHSLGFDPEWAGQRKVRGEPFVEVDGPYPLPPLHEFQRKIVSNLMIMLKTRYPGKTRGLISLPTGSGKTRVAIQGIVDAIRKGVYAGGVVWVADRGELCEQAFEAWRQVWVNRGMEAQPLRISRMWGGQKTPAPVSGQHVVIASIQTLEKRVEHAPSSWRRCGWWY